MEGAIFRDLDDARERIGQFIAYYNFQRTHQGIGGLVPADKFFEAAPEVRAALAAKVAENAKELAVQGAPRKELYLTGKMGDRPISLHSEGTKVVLTDSEGGREEVDLAAGGRRAQPGEEEAPGTSALDSVLEELASQEAGGSETPAAETGAEAGDGSDGKAVS